MSLLKDGYQLLINLTGAGATFEEISGKIPGVTIGNKIDQTTMRNTDWKTYAAQVLKDLTDSTLTVAYDAALLTSITGTIGTNQLITYTLPDGSTYSFWGFLVSFEPGELSMGNRPTAQMVISPSNMNGSDVETGPVSA